MGHGRIVKCRCCNLRWSVEDVTALTEEKNALVRQVAELQAILRSAAERIAAQSELLSKRAEKQGGQS
jgi:hypothetical protein